MKSINYEGNCRAKGLLTNDSQTFYHDEAGYEIHNHGPQYTRREAEKVLL